MNRPLCSRYTTNDDSVVEGMETFSVILSSSVSPNIDDGRITILDTMRAASVTINDNDIDETGRVELSLSAPPSIVSEGVPEGGSVTFTVLLENGVTVGEEITVEWGVLCSSDITPDDFDFVGEDCPSGTLMIPADTAFAEFTVSVRADMVAEGDENFEVRLRNPRSDNFTVFVVDSLERIRILDNDNDLVMLSVSASISYCVRRWTWQHSL